MRVLEVLTQLGLSAKEAAFYIFLLVKGPRTASQISRALGETRTNTYMILDRLAAAALVETDPNIPVKTYAAANPEKLKGLVTVRQLHLRQAQTALSNILPDLSSQYSLGQHKPGVVYLEGVKGYKQSLDDMAKSRGTVNIMASSVAHENQEAWAALESYAFRRRDSDPHSRIIFSKDIEREIDTKRFRAQGYEPRFWGEQFHEAEIAIYDSKVALTVYHPSLITTVITNKVLSETFLVIFEQLWSQAKQASISENNKPQRTKERGLA